MHMDDSDTEQSGYITPSITPHLNDSNTSADFHDLNCSFSEEQYKQQMANLTIANQNQTDLNYPAKENNSEDEAEPLSQEPIEAAHESTDSNPSNTGSAEVIDHSLHPQVSQERDDDTRSPVQATEQGEEEEEEEEREPSSISASDSAMSVQKRSDRPKLVYSRSLCVAYADEQMISEEPDISVIKEVTTTVTEKMFKKDKDLGHVMISYNHSSRALCLKIAECLKKRNYVVWIDRDNISGNVLGSMASAVENSFVVLMAISEKYHQSRYCRLEAEYSVEQNKPSIPLLMQDGYKPLGWLGIVTGAKLYIDFSTLPFDEAFEWLVREIEAVRPSSGSDINDRHCAVPFSNNALTTMNGSLFNFRNVNEWTTDDVIEWLHREKLEIFLRTLVNFTGSTLWQLFKIKFDSAADYHRMIDSLLEPTAPLRLFHILTFNAAIEALFASSGGNIHR